MKIVSFLGIYNKKEYSIKNGYRPIKFKKNKSIFYLLSYKSKIRNHRLIKKAYKWCFRLLGYLPANKKLIVFESFLGKQFSCNPRAIYEYMKEKHPDFKMIWSVDKRYLSNFKNKDIHYVTRFSVRWLFLMTRSRYWVTNSRFPLWIPKPNHTVYVQTWHGTPLKKLATDIEEVHMPGTNTKKYKKNFCKEASKWDYLVSPNDYSKNIFKRAFQFNKEMINSGYPRNDVLFHQNKEGYILKLKKKLDLPLNKKIILYAPTWRDNEYYSKGKYKFNMHLDLDLLKSEVGDKYIVLFRLHYLVSENLDLSSYHGFAYDCSNYEDIRDLYLLADLLITDYSSVFFDYANLKRPMLFYVYDIDTYRDQLRGFYFNFEENAPGPLLKTTEEVIQSIRQMELNNFALPSSFDIFHHKFCHLEDGHATEKVVNRVFFNTSH